MALALAPGPAVGDIFLLKNVTKMAQQVGLNLLHYQVLQVAGAAVTLEEMCAALEARFAPRYKGMMGNQATWEGSVLQRIHPNPSVDTKSVAQAGPAAGGTYNLPPQASMYLTIYTGGAGRRNRGRVYVPFPWDGWAGVGGEVTNTGMAALDLLAADLLAPITVGGAGGGTITLQYGIYARDLKTFKPMIAHRSNAAFGTQDRRSYTGRPDVIPARGFQVRYEETQPAE
jgi:hypothetical protein